MFSIGNEELENAIDVGEVESCPNCGKLHRVEYGKKILEDGTTEPSNTLGFVKCKNGKTYLVAVNGKRVNN